MAAVLALMTLLGCIPKFGLPGSLDIYTGGAAPAEQGMAAYVGAGVPVGRSLLATWTCDDPSITLVQRDVFVFFQVTNAQALTDQVRHCAVSLDGTQQSIELHFVPGEAPGERIVYSQ